ncbi:MAG: PAS domain S-box protein, partial [Methanomicrobiales archaeon]
GERRQQLLDLIDLDNEELQSKYQYVTRKGNTLYAEVFTPALCGGKGAYVWATGSPLFNSHGERIGAIESIRDITEWEHADVALKESEKKYRDIFEHSVTGLFKTAPGGQLIDANDTLARMYGYSGAPEILQAGISVGQLYTSQEDREEVLHILSEKGMVENYEAPHRKRDGTHFWVSITARTIRDEDGTVLFYEGTNLDITGRKMAEDALRESREGLKFALEGTNDGIWDVRMDTGAVYISPRGCEILGYTPDELPLVAQTWGQLVHPDDLPATTAALNAYLEGRVPIFDVEQRLKTKSGNWKWIQVRGKAISRDENGAPTRMVGTHTDITERRWDNEALKEREELLKEAQRVGHLGSWDLNVVTGDLQWSDECYRIYGFRPQEFVPSYEKFRSIIYPEDLAFVQEQVDAALNNDNHYDIDFRFLRPDGEICWIHCEGEVTRDADGKPLRFFGTQIDITERKRVEEELQKSEERFRNVIDAADAYVFEIDAHGTITFLSDRVKDILGYEPQELIGKTPFDTMTTPEEVTRMRAVFGEYLRSKLPIRRMEHNCRSKDGRELMLTVTALPMLDAAGGIKGYQGTVEDITERKLAEELLRQQTDAMEAAIDGLAILDNNQNYTYVNRAHAAIYGYENTRELIGRSWRILYDPIELQRFEQEIMPELGQKGHYQGRATGKKKDGSLFPQEVSLTTLEDGGLICVVRDITERKLAEERLKESEERYLSLFDRSLDCIYIHDFEGNFIDANPAALELMGYTKEDIPDVSFTSLISGDQLNKARATIRAIVETGSHSDVVEYRLQAKNGKFVDIETKGSLILHNKKPYAILGIARDITERKRIDEELMESEEKFRATIGQSRDGILITDEDFHIIEWNATQTTIYGYTRDEMLGRPLWEFQFATLPEEKRSPVLLEKMKQSMLNIRKSSDSAWMNSLHDFEVQNKNGLCRTVQISTFPIVFRDRIFFGSISRDITDKKQAEKELRESEEQLHNFISNLPVGLYRNTAGPLGKCLMANPYIARMHGYDTLEEFLRKPTADMYANPEERVAFSDQLINKGSIFGREIHLKRKNNELFWGRVSAVAVRNQQGDIQYFDGFIEDISDKKRAEEALQLANKKLSLLSSITRHDINNQLVVLLGYLTILQKKQPDPTQNEYFQNTTTAARRISSMIQFTKEYESIGVNAPVWQECSTIVENAAKEAPLGKVTVKNDLPAGAEVFADPLIIKVFYNLMDNAVRHGGKITTISFSVEERGTDHILVCEDDGEGVHQDEKDKIFERGFGENTGMGLALAREILYITGITIHETGEPGKGARFGMTVPKGMWRIAGKSD